MNKSHSDYSTVFLPWGPEWTAKRLQRVLFAKDMVLNSRWFSSVPYHRHPCFFGSMKEVLRDCCGCCPPRPEQSVPEDEDEDVYVSGPLHFMVDRPGRQKVGSFHPITVGDWTQGALWWPTAEAAFRAIQSGSLETFVAAMGASATFPPTFGASLSWRESAVAGGVTGESTGEMVAGGTARPAESGTGTLSATDGGSSGASVSSSGAGPLHGNVQAVDPLGRSLLHVAAALGREDIVAWLLDHGAHSQPRTRDGFTPLHLAARAGHAQVVRLICARAAQRVAEHPPGSPPGQVSAGAGAGAGAGVGEEDAPRQTRVVAGEVVPVARSLAELHAMHDPFDVEAVDWVFQLTALQHACVRGHADCVVALIEHGATATRPVQLSRNLGNEAPCWLAPVLSLCAFPAPGVSDASVINVLRVLLNHGASGAECDSFLRPAVSTIVEFGSLAVVEELLRRDPAAAAALPVLAPHPSLKLATPLHVACLRGDVAVVQLLVSQGARERKVEDDDLRRVQLRIGAAPHPKLHSSPPMFWSSSVLPVAACALLSGAPRELLRVTAPISRSCFFLSGGGTLAGWRALSVDVATGARLPSLASGSASTLLTDLADPPCYPTRAEFSQLGRTRLASALSDTLRTLGSILASGRTLPIATRPTPLPDWRMQLTALLVHGQESVPNALPAMSAERLESQLTWMISLNAAPSGLRGTDLVAGLQSTGVSVASLCGPPQYHRVTRNPSVDGRPWWRRLCRGSVLLRDWFRPASLRVRGALDAAGLQLALPEHLPPRAAGSHSEGGVARVTDSLHELVVGEEKIELERLGRVDAQLAEDDRDGWFLLPRSLRWLTAFGVPPGAVGCGEALGSIVAGLWHMLGRVRGAGGAEAEGAAHGCSSLLPMLALGLALAHPLMLAITGSRPRRKLARPPAHRRLTGLAVRLVLPLLVVFGATSIAVRPVTCITSPWIALGACAVSVAVSIARLLAAANAPAPDLRTRQRGQREWLARLARVTGGVSGVLRTARAMSAALPVAMYRRWLPPRPGRWKAHICCMLRRLFVRMTSPKWMRLVVRQQHWTPLTPRLTAGASGALLDTPSWLLVACPSVVRRQDAALRSSVTAMHYERLVAAIATGDEALVERIVSSCALPIAVTNWRCNLVQMAALRDQWSMAMRLVALACDQYVPLAHARGSSVGAARATVTNSLPFRPASERVQRVLASVASSADRELVIDPFSPAAVPSESQGTTPMEQQQHAINNLDLVKGLSVMRPGEFLNRYGHSMSAMVSRSGPVRATAPVTLTTSLFPPGSAAARAQGALEHITRHGGSAPMRLLRAEAEAEAELELELELEAGRGGRGRYRRRGGGEPRPLQDLETLPLGLSFSSPTLLFACGLGYGLPRMVEWVLPRALWQPWVMRFVPMQWPQVGSVRPERCGMVPAQLNITSVAALRNETGCVQELIQIADALEDQEVARHFLSGALMEDVRTALEHHGSEAAKALVWSKLPPRASAAQLCAASFAVSGAAGSLSLFQMLALLDRREMLRRVGVATMGDTGLGLSGVQTLGAGALSMVHRLVQDVVAAGREHEREAGELEGADGEAGQRAVSEADVALAAFVVACATAAVDHTNGVAVTEGGVGGERISHVPEQGVGGLRRRGQGGSAGAELHSEELSPVAIAAHALSVLAHLDRSDRAAPQLLSALEGEGAWSAPLASSTASGQSSCQQSFQQICARASSLSARVEELLRSAGVELATEESKGGDGDEADGTVAAEGGSDGEEGDEEEEEDEDGVEMLDASLDPTLYTGLRVGGKKKLGWARAFLPSNATQLQTGGNASRNVPLITHGVVHFQSGTNRCSREFLLQSSTSGQGMMESLVSEAIREDAVRRTQLATVIVGALEAEVESAASTLSIEAAEAAPRLLQRARSELLPDNHLVASVLSHTCGIMASNGSGETPLHYAATFGRVDACDALLALSARLDACLELSSPLSVTRLVVNATTEPAGWTPLHVATAIGHVGVVERLLREATCAPLLLDASHGWSAFHHAAFSGKLAVINALVHGVGGTSLRAQLVNQRTKRAGCTPLMLARRHPLVFKYLLSLPEVDPLLTDLSGNSLLHYVSPLDVPREVFCAAVAAMERRAGMGINLRVVNPTEADGAEEGAAMTAVCGTNEQAPPSAVVFLRPNMHGVTAREMLEREATACAALLTWPWLSRSASGQCCVSSTLLRVQGRPWHMRSVEQLISRCAQQRFHRGELHWRHAVLSRLESAETDHGASFPSESWEDLRQMRTRGKLELCPEARPSQPCVGALPSSPDAGVAWAPAPINPALSCAILLPVQPLS